MTDRSRTIPDGEAALVTDQGMEGLRLVLPIMPKDFIVPDLVLLLSACMHRLRKDEDFYEEMLDWFDQSFAETMGRTPSLAGLQ